MRHISELRQIRRKVKTVTPETRLKKCVSQVLKRFGIFSYPVTQGLGCYPGLPDRVAHYNGHVIYLEFKAGAGRLGPKQVEFQERCKRDRIQYHVVRSVEDVERIFELPVLFGGKRK